MQALPKPSILAARLRVTYSFVTGSKLPNKKVVSGLSNFVHFFNRPQSLTICIIPSQKAYIPHNETERVIAFAVADEIAGKKADGFTIINTMLETTNKTTQIIFITYFYEH